MLGQLPIHQSWWGFTVVLFSLAAYVLSMLAGVVTTASLSMVLFLVGAVFFLFGHSVLKQLLFPLFFLLFMIPIPAQIYASMTVPLQLIVSQASVWITALIGVPVTQEGNLIQLPHQTLQVVEACSGLRSMMTLLTLSTLLCYLTLKSRFLSLLLVLSSLPIALLINILRVAAVVVFLWYLNFDLTGGILHTILGLSVNLLALLILFSLRGVLAKWDQASRKN
jgi:exosortase